MGLSRDLPKGGFVRLRLSRGKNTIRRWRAGVKPQSQNAASAPRSTTRNCQCRKQRSLDDRPFHCDVLFFHALRIARDRLNALIDKIGGNIEATDRLTVAVPPNTFAFPLAFGELCAIRHQKPVGGPWSPGHTALGGHRITWPLTSANIKSTASRQPDDLTSGTGGTGETCLTVKD